MPVTVDHVIEALSSLGGTGHNSEIAAIVRQIAPPPFPVDIEAVVRARLQERCAEAKSFKGGQAIVKSVHGIEARRGYWQLLEDPLAVSNADGFQDGVEPFVLAEEWRSQLRMHLRRERSSKLIRAFKERLSNLRCYVCDFDFEQTYGILGEGYIEAHHRVPVSRLNSGQVTRIEDLVPLCANCHRMVHRDPSFDVEYLKSLWGSKDAI